MNHVHQWWSPTDWMPWEKCFGCGEERKKEIGMNLKCPNCGLKFTVELPPMSDMEEFDFLKQQKDRILAKQAGNPETFEQWWSATGRYIDPDTDDVPWFDKRKQLAEEAFNAAKAALLAHVNGLREKLREYEGWSPHQFLGLLEEHRKLQAQHLNLDTELRERIQQLEQQNAALKEALKDLIGEIGHCRCHEAFTSRRLEDPACQFHQYNHILTEQVKAALEG